MDFKSELKGNWLVIFRVCVVVLVASILFFLIASIPHSVESSNMIKDMNDDLQASIITYTFGASLETGHHAVFEKTGRKFSVKFKWIHLQFRIYQTEKGTRDYDSGNGKVMQQFFDSWQQSKIVVPKNIPIKENFIIQNLINSRSDPFIKTVPRFLLTFVSEGSPDVEFKVYGILNDIAYKDDDHMIMGFTESANDEFPVDGESYSLSMEGSSFFEDIFDKVNGPSQDIMQASEDAGFCWGDSTFEEENGEYACEKTTISTLASAGRYLEEDSLTSFG